MTVGRLDGQTEAGDCTGHIPRNGVGLRTQETSHRPSIPSIHSGHVFPCPAQDVHECGCG